MKGFPFITIAKGRQYVYSGTIIILVAAICFALSGFIGYRVAALILLVTVSILALTFIGFCKMRVLLQVISSTYYSRNGRTEFMRKRVHDGII